MIETGTTWLARLPLMTLGGCSSPSIMSTRFGSFSSVTHDVSASSEYRIDRPKNLCNVLALRQAVVTGSLRAGMGSNIEPTPTLAQGTMVGSGAHGQCEETRSISAITRLWPGASSRRWNSARVY